MSQLDIVVTSMCVAVERVSTAPDGTQSLLHAYNAAFWFLSLELELNDSETYSLRLRAVSDHQDPKAAAQELRRLISSSSHLQVTNNLRNQALMIQQLSACKPPVVPPRLVNGRIDEVELETRYDARGCPLPLRRNVLGERYAAKPLSFARNRSATAVFNAMRPRVKQELCLRETRRLARLNAASAH